MAREPVLVEMGLDSGWNVSGRTTDLEEYLAAAGGHSGAIGFGCRPEAACKMAAAGRGIVKAASWSDFEACVTNLPGDARKVAVAAESIIEPAGDGGKGKLAAGGGKGKLAAGGGKGKQAAGGGKGKQAAGGGKGKQAGPRRTKLAPVSQYYIDRILEYRAVNPRHRGPVWNEEMMARFYKDNPEGLETSRSLYAKAAAVFKADEEREDEILKQYNADGSAYLEVEISDDEN